MSGSRKPAKNLAALLAELDASGAEESWLFAAAPRRPVGRPRKWRTLGELAAGKPAKRRRGRRKTIPAADYKSLLVRVIETCKAHGYHGRGAIKKALRRCITEWARANNRALTRELKRLPYLQSRTSDAIKMFPEIAKKLPR